MRRSPTHRPGITSVCAIANSTLLFVMVISVLRINNESFCLEIKKMPDIWKPVSACKNPLSHTGCWPFYNDPPVGKMSPKCKILSTRLGPQSQNCLNRHLSADTIHKNAKEIVYVCKVSKNHIKRTKVSEWGH